MSAVTGRIKVSRTNLMEAIIKHRQGTLDKWQQRVDDYPAALDKWQQDALDVVMAQIEVIRDGKSPGFIRVPAMPAIPLKPDVSQHDADLKLLAICMDEEISVSVGNYARYFTE